MNWKERATSDMFAVLQEQPNIQAWFIADTDIFTTTPYEQCERIHTL